MSFFQAMVKYLRLKVFFVCFCFCFWFGALKTDFKKELIYGDSAANLLINQINHSHSFSYC